MSAVSANASAAVEVIGDVLDGYASKGVFRGYSRGRLEKGKAVFKMRWHHDRMYECVFDAKKDTLRFPGLLPNVPGDSAMYGALKAYVKGRQSEAMLEHRRIDKAKAEARTYNRGGNVTLSLKVKDGDYAYGARKLVNLVHEIFLDFLYDGRYHDYLVETMGLNLDQY